MLDEHSKAYEEYQDPEWDRIVSIAKSGSGPLSPLAEDVARELNRELNTAFGPYDPASLGELAIELSMPKLPLVGQSADVILDVSSPHSASPVSTSFEIRFTGDVRILSSDPPPYSGEFTDNIFFSPKIRILPGETHQFIVTIMPLNETPLAVDVFNERRHLIMPPEDAIRISIGNRSSDYQINEGSHTKNPFTQYVWTEVLYPDCWWPPWDGSGQTIYDYYADRGIEIHDAIHWPSGGCAACGCVTGSMMFLTPEYDRADVLSINFGKRYGWEDDSSWYGIQ